MNVRVGDVMQNVLGQNLLVMKITGDVITVALPTDLSTLYELPYPNSGLHIVQPLTHDPTQYLNNVIRLGYDEQRSERGGLTKYQLQHTPFVSLIHTTTITGLTNIFKSGKLDHSLSLMKDQGRQITMNDIESLTQYPGVYTEIYTSDHYHTLVSNPNRFGQKYRLILSLALLQQQNWHYNSVDQYGMLDTHTYTPQTLPHHIHEIPSLWTRQPILSELVFHHAIPISFVQGVLVENELHQTAIQKIVGPKIQVFVSNRGMLDVLSNSISNKYIDQWEKLSREKPQYCYIGPIQEINDEIKSRCDIELTANRQDVYKKMLQIYIDN